MQQGMGIVQFQQQQQDRQTALTEKAAAVEAAKAKAVEDAKRNMYQMQRFDEVRKNPTTDAIERLALEFPQQAESLLKVHKTKSERVQKENIALGSRAQAAFRSGQPQIGQQILEEAAAGREAQGDVESAKGLRKIAEMSKKDLGAATLSTGMFLSAAMAEAGMSFKDTFQAIETADADKQKAQAEADIKQVQAKREDEKIMAEIALDKANTARLHNLTRLDGERLGIDKDRLRIEAAKELRDAGGAGSLSPASQKMVTEAAVDAATAAVEQKSVTDIAALFGGDKAPMLDGGASAIGRFAGKQIGFSTEEQRARQKYGALVEKMVSADLKGLGNATEADRAAASSAYPSKDAPFSVIKAFLDDRALKIEDRRQRKKAEIEYVRQNNGLGPAQQPMIVGGVEVMPGETFDEAIIRIENSK